MTDIVKLLKSIGAITTNDHFVYTSGKHGSVYVRKDMLYPNTKKTSEVCKLIAEKFKDKDIDIVVGPSIGGIILSQWTAHHLSKLKKKEIPGIFTEKDGENNQIFKREYDKLVKDKKVLIVEDLTTTGGSVKKVVNSVRRASGKVIAVCVMINRDPKNVTSMTIGAPLSYLGIFKAESFDEKDCPLCKKNVEINTAIGHGKKYLHDKEK
ncbi:MAG: phosphoribosyltransferase family protein [Candidatus Parcubacteria bacterium]|nr:phosphoribosyltransferase family protein [Candidatus Parcubacteria bacterium]